MGQEYIRTSFSCLSIIFMLAGTTCGVSRQVLSKELYNHLFNEYDTNLIPICSKTGTVTTTIDIALRQIMELNEPLQTLRINVWFRLKWNDCRLTWDPSLFNNLTYLSVQYSDVWFPDVTLVDSAAEEMFGVYVHHTGTMYYKFPTVMTSSCRVNAKYFPFDEQTCSIKVGSWSHHGFELDLLNKFPYGDLDYYIENNEWLLKGFPSDRYVLVYNCCEEPYPVVQYHVILQRRPTFYVMTLLFPCVLVLGVAAFAFILPTESGEKISLEMTALLSLAVYMLVISESLPPTADNFPILGSFFAASVVLVACSLLQTVIVVNVFHCGSSGRKVPNWIKTICFKYIGRLVFHCPSSRKEDKERETRRAPASTLYDEYSDIYKRRDSDMYQQRDSDIYQQRDSDMYQQRDSDINQRRESDIYKRIDIEQSARKNNYKIHHNHNHIPYDFPRLHIGQVTNQFLPPVNQSDLLEEPTLNELKEHTRLLKVIDEAIKDKSADDIDTMDWRDVANVLDRVFLVLYFGASVTLVILYLLPSQ